MSGIPPYQDFCLPILRVLAAEQAPLSRLAVADRVADVLGLTETQRIERVGTTAAAKYRHRAGWALAYLNMGGFVSSPARGQWTIAEKGRVRLTEARPFSSAETRTIYRASSAGAGDTSDAEPLEAHVQTATPLERIQQARAEIHNQLRAELRERPSTIAPEQFESLAVSLLQAMGYSGTHGSALTTGKTGDGGIDGILSQDRLGLDRVYVQAKRWKDSVSSPTVRDFAGAMDAAGATKGVILTTSRFTSDAAKYVDSSPKSISLVDGDRLTELMIEFSIGAQVEHNITLSRRSGLLR